MAKISQLAQFLLHLDPQQDVGRLAFYHFLKNCCDINSEFRPEIVDLFYRRCLNFEYWRNHRRTLGHTVKKDLESFVKDSGQISNWVPVVHGDERQIFEVENDSDRKAILRHHLLQQGDIESVQILNHDERKVLTLQKTTYQGLRVQVYNHYCTIEGAQLIPLAPIAWLEYDAQLDLLQQKTHYLPAGPMCTAFFEFSGEQARGLFLKGYTLQRFESFQGKHISQSPELYFAIKTIERHFISAHSDPFYQELVQTLQQTLTQLDQYPQESQNFAQKALHKARTALDTLFPEDQFLRLLVTHLEYKLSGLGLPNSPASEQLPSTLKEFQWQNSKPLPQ